MTTVSNAPVRAQARSTHDVAQATPDRPLTDATPAPGAAELDRQVQVLVDAGYPTLLGISPAALRARAEPLRATVAGLDLPAGWREDTAGRIPFVLVVPDGQVPAAQAMAPTALNGRPGFTVLDEQDAAGFVPIDQLTIPAAPLYLLLDVDTGSDLRDAGPEPATQLITARGRSPLTIAEGIALITQLPERLRKNHCFSLAGSRCGDRRVAALWISDRRPKLGWCFAGAPHTWLGTASCAARTDGS